MVQNQATLQRGVGIHCWRVLYQIHHSTQHTKAHGADRMGTALSLIGMFAT